MSELGTKFSAETPAHGELAITQPESPRRIRPELFINRELSWLAFNQRVLEHAQDQRLPLLERVKFLAIFSANLDEFFMVRVARLKEQIATANRERSPDNMSAAEQLRAIRHALTPLIATRQRLFQDELLPALRAAGINLLRYHELSAEQRRALALQYERDIFPVLTPLAVDPSHPFPFISNLSLNLAVVIDDPHMGERFARLKVPEVLPRLMPIAPDGESGLRSFVWLEDVIAANAASLFPGKPIREIVAFRITRDSDLEVDETEAANLLHSMEVNVRERRFGPVVRLSIDARTSQVVRELLTRNLEVTDDDVYLMEGPLGLRALMDVYAAGPHELKDPAFTPRVQPLLENSSDMFATIRHQDVLLHHPFDSFETLTALIDAAAHDPDVLAIKQTLYRVGRNSPIVASLIAAREQGKQVAVLVELKARFDEENNIEWARAMESAGVHVTYGLLGLKTHAKMLLIVRKEEGRLRRYVHLGTGNYNASTARLYTDMGVLTCDPAIGADMSELFNALTGYSSQTSYRKLLVAPHSLRHALIEKIEREIEQHRRTGDGHLIFKCNALIDEQMIIALYRAAQAGVQIDLIIRGVCGLRPGVPGISERIRVRSIVGRFLEHSRIYYFHNGGMPELYLGSADLMTRNLDRRVETVFPVTDVSLRQYLRDTVLDAYLRDNTQAWELRADGTYERVAANDQPINAQLLLLEHARS